MKSNIGWKTVIQALYTATAIWYGLAHLNLPSPLESRILHRSWDLAGSESLKLYLSPVTSQTCQVRYKNNMKKHLQPLTDLKPAYQRISFLLHSHNRIYFALSLQVAWGKLHFSWVRPDGPYVQLFISSHCLCAQGQVQNIRIPQIVVSNLSGPSADSLQFTQRSYEYKFAEGFSIQQYVKMRFLDRTRQKSNFTFVISSFFFFYLVDREPNKLPKKKFLVGEKDSICCWARI